MTSIELTAPAKVNLFLKVLDKRRDSYHNILTLFERISLSDTIRIVKTPRGITVTSDRRITGRARDNMAYKAAELIMRPIHPDGGVRIEIMKRIPMAAGLGGGSSDAAAVLVGINRLYSLGLSKSALMRLGAKLGADVPFFIMNTPFAIGRARGDKLTKSGLKLRPWHLLVYPGPFKASTGDVYAALGRYRSEFALIQRHSSSRTGSLPNCLTRHSGGAKITLPKDWKGLESLLHNDLGDVAAKIMPVIGKTIQCLVASLGKKAVVSGSGPSVFCLYRTRKEAFEAKRSLFGSIPAGKRKLWQVFIVRTKV